MEPPVSDIPLTSVFDPQGVGCAEGGGAPRLLQRAEGGHAHPRGVVHEPEAPPQVHQEEPQDGERQRGTALVQVTKRPI